MKKILIFIAILALSINLTFALEDGLSINTLPTGQKVIIKEVRETTLLKLILGLIQVQLTKMTKQQV